MVKQDPQVDQRKRESGEGLAQGSLRVQYQDDADEGGRENTG